jgi:hypothetical protein
MQSKSMDDFTVTQHVYEEHQLFARWVYVLGIAIAFIGTGSMIWAWRTGNGTAPPPEFIVFFVTLSLYVFDGLTMRTKVDSDGVRVRVGYPIPTFWKRFGIDAIREARAVTYRPLMNAGGWGLRFGWFEGRFTIFWTARGNRGVLIETANRRYIIGSQDPERLHAAIERERNCST